MPARRDLPSSLSSPWPPAGWDELVSLLPEAVRRAVAGMPVRRLAALRELRLRAGRPLVAVFAEGNRYVAPDGALCMSPTGAYVVTVHDARAFLSAVTRASVYAHERELQEGFLTLPGGHRIGFAGEGIVEGGRLRTLRHVGSFNVRIAREVTGAAAAVAPRLVLPSGRIAHTLFVSPPGCGKTTVLRDLARLLSTGTGSAGPGWRVVVIDERGELAACRDGIPRLDVGANTDVLASIPKAEAVAMAVRALGPQVIVTDEVGAEDEWDTLAYAQRSGVSVVAAMHGDDVSQAVRAGEPAGVRWERVVLLSARGGPGTVEAIHVISGSTSQ